MEDLPERRSMLVSRYRKVLLILTVLVLLAVIGTYGLQTYSWRSHEPGKPDKIKVVEAEHSILALPHYIALAQGFYREQKLELESRVLFSDQNDLKLTGQGDVFLGNLCQSTFTRPLGTGAHLVAFAGVSRKDGTFLLAQKDEKSFSWGRLKLKTVLGDAPDNQSNIVLEEALRQNNLTLQQVIIMQNIPPDLKEGAFQAGVGHYVQMAEPQATLTESKGNGKIATFLGSTVGTIPSLVFAAPKNYLKDHSEAIQKLVNGLCKGMLWLDYHKPAEAARVVAPFFPNLDEQTMLKMIERYKKSGMWDKSPAIDKEDYDRLQDYVRRAGELTNPVNFQDGVNNKFATKATKTIEYIPPELQKKPTRWEKIKSLMFN